MAQGIFLFLGDTYLANFSWQERMPLFEVHNLGRQEETVEGLLHRLETIEQSVPEPHIILVMTGIGNVIAGDYTFVDQIKRIIIRLSNIFPQSEIIINSLPHIEVPLLVENAVFHLNNNLREMARQTGSCYLDNFDTLAATEEAIFSQDGIQLTPQAYDRWARSILEYVAFLLEDD